MSADPATVLGILYLCSEIALAARRRAQKAAADADRGSLSLLWIVIGISMFLGFGCAQAVPTAAMDHAPRLRIAGSVLFVAGLTLRWYSILHLGRFFTVNVAIAADHRLIDTGPYRWVRHPSYTGALAAFAGLGLCLANWVSLAVILLPVTAVFLRRIHVEEAALEQALGDPYRSYEQRTKRLIPAIY